MHHHVSYFFLSEVSAFLFFLPLVGSLFSYSIDFFVFSNLVIVTEPRNIFSPLDESISPLLLNIRS